MGRRSRKRGLAGTGTAPLRSSTAAASTTPRQRTYRARRSEAPPAPWAPVPLAEISILIGLALLIAGLVTGVHVPRGQALVSGGVLLIGLASLEVSVREHIGGYRSHTTLLAGAAAITTLFVLWEATGLPRYVLAVVALSVFTFVWRLLRGVFMRRGGLNFRA